MKPIYLILGIAHSNLAKHVAPRVLDESLVEKIKPALARVEDAIKQLKLKDLKTAQDILNKVIVRLANKFGADRSKSTNDALSAEIEGDLKKAQESATNAVHSGLGSAERVSFHH